MASFFQELAKKLAERWAALLLVPGVLFLVVAWVGSVLGQARAADWGELAHAAAERITAFSRQPLGVQALLLGAALLAATMTGLTVQALAGPTRRLWLGEWPYVLAPLRRWRAGRRRVRWHRRVDERRRLERAHPRDTRTPEQQRRIDEAAARANALALAEPGTPTWMGDRMCAVAEVARGRYGLDLPFVWPRLWLVMPAATRDEITAAHAAFAAAVATGTWAWPYLLLGALWWPAAVAGLGVCLTGWTRARAAITDVSMLTEAALDLHSRALAIALGVGDLESTGPLAIPEGQLLTAITRKGR